MDHVLAGWIGYRLLTALIRRLLQPMIGATDYPARAQRARTLVPLLTSAARYMVAFMVGVIILQEVGIDIRAVLVSAGVVGASSSSSRI